MMYACWDTLEQCTQLGPVLHVVLFASSFETSLELLHVVRVMSSMQECAIKAFFKIIHPVYNHIQACNNLVTPCFENSGNIQH
jgi:hypothetical protein